MKLISAYEKILIRDIVVAAATAREAKIVKRPPGHEDWKTRRS